MAILGFGNLVDTNLPPMWDGDTILARRLAAGRSFQEVAQEMNMGLVAASAAFLQNVNYGGLFAVQDDPAIDYRSGTGIEMVEITEHGTPNPYRSDTRGHTLPLKNYAAGVGWTLMGLQDRRASQIDADIRAAIDGATDLLEKKALERFFRMEGEAVGATNNASLPFADGGATDAGYTPPTVNGKSFASSHNHYMRLATLNDAAVNQAVGNLAEHGHAGPFHIITSDSDNTTWTALTGYVPPSFAEIMYGANQDRAATLTGAENYIGIFKSSHGVCYLWNNARVPTGYFGVYKSYGQGHAANPLRMQITSSFGYGVKLATGQWVNTPHLLAVPAARMGYGVGADRTNGVLVRIAANGDYITPAIS